MGSQLRILHLVITLLSVLVTIMLTAREVERRGFKFEIKLERLPGTDREPAMQVAGEGSIRLQ